MGISVAYGASDIKQSITTIQKAFEPGVTLFATADIYSGGESEKLVGKFIADSGSRDAIVLATKFAFNDAEIIPCQASPFYLPALDEQLAERLLFYQEPVMTSLDTATQEVI